MTDLYPIIFLEIFFKLYFPIQNPIQDHELYFFFKDIFLNITQVNP